MSRSREQQGTREDRPTVAIGGGRRSAGPADARSRSLRFHLTLFVVALLVTVSAALIAFNYDRARQASLDAATREIRLLSHLIVDRYRAVFASVSVAVDLASAVEIAGAGEIAELERLLPFLRRILESSEYTDSAYVGFGNGVFLDAVSIKNNPRWQSALNAPADAALAVRLITLDEQGNRMSRWNFLAADGATLSEGKPEAANYDPRQRPWYEAAVQQPSLISTSPYRMATTGALGITLARRTASDGSVVFGADILLDGIEAFLSTQLVTPNSRVYFFDTDNRLIAQSHAAADNGQAGDSLLQRAEGLAAALATKEGSTETFSFDGQDYLAAVSWISGIPLLKDGRVATITPIGDLTGDSDRLLRQGLVVSGTILVIGVICAFIFAYRIGSPLRAITDQANRMRRFEPMPEADVRSRIAEIAQLALAVSAAHGTITAFALYVPRDLVRRIVGFGEFTRRSGRRQVVTALFSDIKDFTTISEQNSAEDVVSMLSEYFDLFSQTIKSHNGVIIQFSGDGVFALWNAPEEDSAHVENACKCAIELKQRIDAFNTSQRAAGAPEFITRFGIHTGAVVVGSVGARDRFQYTAMGDAINVASRLEELNKEFSTTILVSDAVIRSIEAKFAFTPLGAVQIKGRTESVAVFTLAENQNIAGQSAIGDASIGRYEFPRRSAPGGQEAAVDPRDDQGDIERQGKDQKRDRI